VEQSTSTQPFTASKRYPSKHAGQAHHFLSEVQVLLEPGNPSGVSLLAFIRRELRKRDMTDYNELEILSEAMLRGFDLVMSGGVEIVNPPAWIRKTALHCVQELWRRQCKQTPLDYECPDQNQPILLDQLALKTDLEILDRAFKELDPEEQRLLYLRFFEGLPWLEIKKLLEAEGKTVSEPALRKQKERIIKRLRWVYHSLRPLAKLDLETD
jgi:RNA polymerase sigma factor (sigma-70 family)